MGHHHHTNHIKSKVKQHIQNYLCSFPLTAKLLSRLSSEGDVLLFGGAVRDIADGVQPRDYDIVVNLREKSPIEEFLNGIEYRKNRFGGCSFTLEKHKFDLWSLESTWAFRENLLKASIDNLVNTVFFNIDSVAVNISNNNAYADKYLDAMEKKRLDIVLPDNPYPALCVLRAFVFKKKKQLEFSNVVKEYISAWVASTPSPLKELNSTQEKHYGFPTLDQHTLMQEISAFL